MKHILRKTCSSCGQSKPLTAFTEMAGPAGPMYGNICASCRKTNMEKGDRLQDKSGSTGTQHNIDADVRKESETRKLLDQEEKTEEAIEERELQEEIRTELNEKAGSIADAHKKRIEGSFLDKSPYKTASAESARTIAERVFGGEAQAEKEKINTVGDMLDTQIIKTKYQGERWKAYSAVNRNWLTKTPASKTQQAQPKSADNKTLNAYAEKTWGPNSRKR